MKYLVESLVTDNNKSKVQRLILSFWFWEAGEELEKTLDGCLRSFLWQCLHNHYTKKLVYEVLHSDIPESAWTRSRLISSFKTCLKVFSKAGIAVTIFLDGLDESVSDADCILEFFTDFTVLNSQLRICMSSRPEQMFVDELTACPKLRLQDLNERDIKKFIDKNFFKSPKVAKLVHGKNYVASDLERKLTEKAQGVFLWVALAVRSLIRGLTNRDSIEILEARLDELPDDLNGLYTLMIGRNENDMRYYKKAAALYFRLTLHRDSFSVLQFCLAANEALRQRILEPPFASWDIATLESDINGRDMLTWIPARSGGLLEIEENSLDIGLFLQYGNLYGEDYNRASIPQQQLEYLSRISRSTVRFIHRTARTYLLETVPGNILLSSCSLSSDDLNRCCFEVWLIQEFVLPALYGFCPGIHGTFLTHWTCGGCCPVPCSTAVDTAICVLTELSRRGLLTCAKVVPGTVPLSTDIVPFPSTDDGLIDAWQVCCSLGWFHHCWNLINKSPGGVDVQNLSVLLAFSLSTTESYGWKDIEHWGLISFWFQLLRLGAHPECKVESPYNGKLSLLPLLLSFAEHKSAQSLVSQSLTQHVQGTMLRAEPSITCCDFYTCRIHQIRHHWSDGHRDAHSNSEWMIWIDYSISHVVEYEDPLLPTYIDSKASRAYVLGFAKELGAQNTTLLALTKAESLAIVSILENIELEKLRKKIYLLSGGVRMASNGIIFVKESPTYSSDYKLTRSLVDIFEGVRQRTQPFKTLFDALLYLGKPEDSILKYIADKEADFRRWRSESEVNAWKSWVLGPPAASQAT